MLRISTSFLDKPNRMHEEIGLSISKMLHIAYVSPYLCSQTCKQTNKHMNTPMHTPTHTHMHMCMHTHTHTHIMSEDSSSSSSAFTANSLFCISPISWHTQLSLLVSLELLVLLFDFIYYGFVNNIMKPYSLVSSCLFNLYFPDVAL